MKKQLLAIFALLTISTAAFAGGSYTNINLYSSNKISAGDVSYDSSYGIGITYGRNFTLVKTDFLKGFTIGVDATFLDASYHKYDVAGAQVLGMETSWKQMDLGVQVGPAFNLTLIEKLEFKAYGRYAPTYSGMFVGDDFWGGYASMFLAGGAIEYRFIRVGIEGRWGRCDYNGLLDSFSSSSSANKITNRGLRTYVGFSF